MIRKKKKGPKIDSNPQKQVSSLPRQHNANGIKENKPPPSYDKSNPRSYAIGEIFSSLVSANKELVITEKLKCYNSSRRTNPVCVDHGDEDSSRFGESKWGSLLMNVPEYNIPKKVTC